jgi:uncharacterized coiled-coil protein SlyX
MLISRLKHHAASQIAVRADEIAEYLRKGYLLRMRGEVSGQVNLISPAEIKREVFLIDPAAMPHAGIKARYPRILRSRMGSIACKEAPMVDASYSRQKQQEDRATVQASRRRLIVPLVAGFVLIGAGWTMVWAFGGSTVVAPSPGVTASATSSDELIETTKGLEATQQQTVDQLQVVQDRLAAQQTETKKLSEQIATLTEKLHALEQSVANIPAPPVPAPGQLPKAPPSKR